MTSLKKLHHVGIPVTDIERSAAWYRDVLGIIAAGVEGAGDSEDLAQMLEVPNVDVRGYFLRLGDDMVIELLEHRRQDRRPFELRNCDIGAVHICFAVDDIQSVYEQLKAKGVHINGAPLALDGTGGDLDGHSFCYFRDPDGVQLELMQLPEA